MTTCPDQKDLQRYADGELKAPKKSRVAEHVQGCELCARAIEQLERVGRLVSGAIRKETESHDLSGLWGRVRKEIASPAPQPTTWERLMGLLWKPTARVAYAALVVLVTGMFAVKALLPGVGRDVRMMQAQVKAVYAYDPDVTVSVVMASESNSAVVLITGLEATEEN